MRQGLEINLPPIVANRGQLLQISGSAARDPALEFALKMLASVMLRAASAWTPVSPVSTEYFLSARRQGGSFKLFLDAVAGALLNVLYPFSPEIKCFVTSLHFVVKRFVECSSSSTTCGTIQYLP